MLNTKLERIKDLIQQKEKIDAELSQLLGEAEKPKRGRPISRWSQSSATSSHLCKAAWLYASSSSIPQNSETGWELSSKQSLWALRIRTPMTRYGRTLFAFRSKISRVSLLFETSLSFFRSHVTREIPSCVI